MRVTSYTRLFLLLEICLNFFFIDARSREKRLIWLPGVAKVQVIVGVGIPADLVRETVIFGFLYKANYALPSNYSSLFPSGIIYQRGTRSVSSYYHDTVNIFQRSLSSQIPNGGNCTLKAICEMANMVSQQNEGLVAEIVGTVLSYFGNNVEEIGELSHLEAYVQGLRNPQACVSIYNKCKIGFMELLNQNQ